MAAHKADLITQNQHILSQVDDEIVQVWINPSVESIVEQQDEGLNWFDGLRPMLEEYSEQGGHTQAFSGVVIDF